MKNNIALIMITLCSLSFYSYAETSVGTGGERNKTIKTEGSNGRNKAIEIANSTSKVNDIIRESLSNKSLSESALNDFTSSVEYSAHSIIKPFFTAIERGEIDVNYNETIGKIRSCGLFSYKPIIPIAPAFGYGTLGGINSSGAGESSIKTVRSRYFNVRNDESDRVFKKANDHFGIRSDYPTPAISCYYLYGNLIKNIINKTKKESIYSKRTFANDSHNYVANLKVTIAKAIVSTLKNLDLYYEAEKYAESKTTHGCQLPTVTGMYASSFSWGCGSFRFEEQTQEAFDGNLKIFSADQFFGITASFTEVNTISLAQSIIDSDSSIEINGKSITNELKTVLTKERGTNTTTSSGNQTSSGSDIQ